MSHLRGGWIKVYITDQNKFSSVQQWAFGIISDVFGDDDHRTYLVEFATTDITPEEKDIAKRVELSSITNPEDLIDNKEAFIHSREIPGLVYDQELED